MSELATVIGLVVFLVAATAAEAWIAIQGYQAGGFWGAFWAVLVYSIIVALVKWAWGNQE